MINSALCMLGCCKPQIEPLRLRKWQEESELTLLGFSRHLFRSFPYMSDGSHALSKFPRGSHKFGKET